LNGQSVTDDKQKNLLILLNGQSVTDDKLKDLFNLIECSVSH